VIQNAAMIRVTFHDGAPMPAQLTAAPSLIDVAMLKVNVGRGLPVLGFYDSDRAQPASR
jgi:S1-C subfamily serine protease